MKSSFFLIFMYLKYKIKSKIALTDISQGSTQCPALKLKNDFLIILNESEFKLVFLKRKFNKHSDFVVFLIMPRFTVE